KLLKLGLKVAVVLSAIILVGGLVAYRAGAFDGLIRPVMMGSSKSGPAFHADQLSPSAAQPANSSQVQLPGYMMSGSKSIAPLIPGPPSTPSQQTDADKAKSTPTIMPSSKSGGVLVPPGPASPPPNSQSASPPK